MKKKLEESKYGKLVMISPKDQIYQLFCLIVTISCLLSSYVYSYSAAFRLHDEREVIWTTFFTIFFELIFLAHMVTQFILEYTPEGSKNPVRDYKRIAMHYINEGDFKADFIAIIPFQIITMRNGRQKLFLLIKLVRLAKGLKLFNV